jgi:hypothetical protein
MLCYRYEALVASHLEPEQFGLYMAMGTQKNTRGNVVFFEVDRNLKSDYFKLDDIEKRCVPHEDGTPKRSKYISIYRVLEHLPVSALGKLYLTTADGRVLSLYSQPYDQVSEKNEINLYEELCPIAPMVVSKLAPTSFCQFMTDPKNPIHVPRIFFADMIVDRDETGRLAGFLPYSNSHHIIDCIKELEQGADKPTKTVSRNPLYHGFFRTIKRGFFVGDNSEMKFYKFPDRRSLEIDYSKWWRSASESLS